MSSLETIKNVMRSDNALYSFDILNTTQLPQRVLHSLQNVKPDEVLIINNKPIILFFHKHNPLTKSQIFKNAWNFGEAPIIIIENESDFEVYNGFEFIVESKELEKLTKNNLNYLSILNGDYYEELKSTKKSTRLDTVLLKNIKDARDELLKNGLQGHRDIANSLIGRIIFIRYLIDREIKLKKYNKIDLKSILENKETTYELFEYLKSDDGFNGDWFPIIKDEKEIVQESHLAILNRLVSGYDFKSKTGSLFDIYDFSIIPIEFISNVYESFIGEEEQRTSGAYYTPTFLVDYILKYTVDEFFKNNPNEYNCKVLDPACGSGIFLVETFRKLVAQFQKVKKRQITANELKQLVKDNIFGIDKDPSAVSISVFSLYLTMLDYQTPKELVSFTFPYLLKGDKNEDEPNFFHNDFFDTKDPYNDILKEKKLDFIVGNPPYGGSSIEKDSFAQEYIVNESFSIGNKDIVQAFMVRVKDFASSDTQISFIVTSKVLYNLQSKDFRTHFFNNFKLNHILELSSVRKEIFENANVPVSILFYQKSNKEEIENHLINYISMKPNPYFEKLKILMLSRSDFKKVLQTKLLENDYLWKILVYGSYLDFNFIKRLKSSYITIDKISEECQYVKGMGIQAHQGKYDISYHLGKEFIETPRGKHSEKYMSAFYIANTLPKWNISNKVYRKGEEKLFDEFSVIIRRGVNTHTLRAKSAVLYKKAVFKHSLTGVNVPDEKKAKNFVGLINSSLFIYFNLQVASSLGIEREILHDEEKLEVPFVEDINISSSVAQIENLKKEHFDEHILQESDYELKLNKLLDTLDNTVLNAFNLNEQEYALVDYANSIVIPWVIQKKYGIAFEKLSFKDKRLEEYVNITLNKNQEFYQNIGKFFQATILWNRYAIGVYYKVLDKGSNEPIVWEKESNIENFLRITNKQPLKNLFIQKDIKGFESDGYYVIKPNEYKNWHKAIGYLDFYEFEKAILDAGRGA